MTEIDPVTAEQTEPTSPELPRGPEALEEALHRAGQAREEAVHLMAVEIDRVKLKVRKLLILAALACLAAFAVVAILFVAIALALFGLAELIGQAFGGRTWAGALVLGGGILLLTSSGLWGGIAWWNRSSFKATVQRYQTRRRSAANVRSVVEPMPGDSSRVRGTD